MSILLKSIPIVFVSFILAGCLDEFEGDTGAPGTIDTVELSAAVSSLPGVNCWDLNADGIKGVEEDRDYNGTVDVNDCHVDAAVVKQNPAALYDQNKMCKVLHSLSVDPALLADIGCHSTPSFVPLGTVQRVTEDTFRNHSFNIENVLKVEISAIKKLGEFVVVGGYVGHKLISPIENTATAITNCEALCKTDDECAVAYINTGLGENHSIICNILYHSDEMASRGQNWSRICGLSIDDGTGSACMSPSFGNSVIWMKSVNTL